MIQPLQPPFQPLPQPLAAPLILASTSRYRRELLQRLQRPFEVMAPEVDETPLPGETPLDLAVRLARAKAHAVATQRPDALVIGSDQVLDLDGEPLGKPMTHERAVAQLQRLSGRTMRFHTAVSVVCIANGFEAGECVPIDVEFEPLDLAAIERYLAAEPAYDCAGSARSESLGIALLRRIASDDPTALIGLPLIATCRLLRAAGLQLP